MPQNVGDLGFVYHIYSNIFIHSFESRALSGQLVLLSYYMMANPKTIKKQFELFLIPCSLEFPYFTRIPFIGYCPEMRCRPTFELGYICCIWNVPRSWSILRFSFQTLRADISLNIEFRTLLINYQNDGNFV